nr:hypothetical protein Iba_chr12eCG4050 [Ipomoea batatas]
MVGIVVCIPKQAFVVGLYQTLPTMGIIQVYRRWSDLLPSWLPQQLALQHLLPDQICFSSGNSVMGPTINTYR